MKKIKFLSGLFAMAAVALATTFTSCEQEEFNFEVEQVPAQLTFTVSVVDLATNTNVTDATITGADAVTAAKGETIAANSYQITATKNGATGSVTVNAPAVAPGQVVNMAAVVFLSSDNVVKVEGDVVADGAVTVKYGNQGEFTHSHNGIDWAKNESNYLLPFTASWDVKVNYTLKDSEMIIPTVSLANFIEANKEFAGENLTGEEELQATAWSYYNAKYEITAGTATYTFESVATGDEVGSATYAVSAVEVMVENVDMAIPGHGHAYGMGHGHGHGHGDAPNAGGGIIYAD